MRTNPTVILLCASVLQPPVSGQTVPEQSAVPQLRMMLASKDAAVRLAAAEGLATCSPHAMGLPAQAAVPDLLTALARDPEEHVAQMAALTLAELGPWPLGVLDFAKTRLDAWRTAGAAQETVAQIQKLLSHPERAWLGVTIVPSVVELLRVPKCAADALAMLAMLGEDASVAIAEIDALVVGGDDAKRWRAAFALSMIGAPKAPSLQVVLEDKHPAVRMWALRARLAGEIVAAEVVARVRPWLEDPRRLVRLWAIAAVVAVGDAGCAVADKLAGLLVLEGNLHGPIAKAAFGALSALGEQAVAATPELVRQLESSSAEQQGYTMQVLARIGPVAGAAVEPLLKIVREPATGDRHGVQHAESNRLQAALALAKIAPQRAVQALLPGFDEEPKTDHIGEWWLVARFCQLGPAAGSTLPHLREMLGRDGAKNKLRALRAIKAIGPTAVPALPDVVAHLTHGNRDVRWHALWAIGAMGVGAAGALPPLQDLFRSHPALRNYIVECAGQLGPAAEPLLIHATKDDKAWVRRSAAAILLKLQTPTPDVSKAVLGLLDRGESHAGISLLWHLEQAPAYAEMADRHMRKLLSGPDANMREHCCHYMWRKFARDVARPPWQPYSLGFSELLNAWQFRTRAPDQCEMFGNAAEVAAWARTFVSSKEERHRRAAAEVLGQLPGSDASFTALQELATDVSPYVRRAAVQSLGWHGNKARAALLVLAQASADSDWFVRADATIALRAVHD